MIPVDDLTALTDEDREWLALGRHLRAAAPEKYALCVVQLAEILEALRFLASRSPAARMSAPIEILAPQTEPN